MDIKQEERGLRPDNAGDGRIEEGYKKKGLEGTAAGVDKKQERRELRTD